MTGVFFYLAEKQLSNFDSSMASVVESSVVSLLTIVAVAVQYHHRRLRYVLLWTSAAGKHK